MVKYNKKIIGSAVILIIFGIFLIITYVNSNKANDVATNREDIFEEQSNNSSVQDKSSYITVYINGEVKSPGVYKLKQDSRLEDLVRACGGFTNEANSYKLNLAKKLKDEDYIFVDRKLENEKQSQSQNTMQQKITEDDKININAATKEELKDIPGIGDVTAQKIIDYREKNGDFSSVEDLKNIDRIGDKTLDKMRDKIDIR